MRHAHHGGNHLGTHGHGVGHGGQTTADVSRKGKRDAINGRIFRQREIHGKRRLSVKVQQILAAKIKQDGGKVKRFFAQDGFFCAKAPALAAISLWRGGPLWQNSLLWQGSNPCQS